MGPAGKGWVGHPAAAKSRGGRREQHGGGRPQKGYGGRSLGGWAASGCSRCCGHPEGSASPAGPPRLPHQGLGFLCVFYSEKEPVALNHESSELSTLFSHHIFHVDMASVPNRQVLCSTVQDPHTSHPSPRAEEAPRPGGGGDQLAPPS